MTTDPQRLYQRRDSHAIIGAIITFVATFEAFTEIAIASGARLWIYFDHAEVITYGNYAESASDRALTLTGWAGIGLAFFAFRAFYRWYMASPFVTRAYARMHKGRTD